MLSAGRMRCCSGDTVNGMVFVWGGGLEMEKKITIFAP